MQTRHILKLVYSLPFLLEEAAPDTPGWVVTMFAGHAAQGKTPAQKAETPPSPQPSTRVSASRPQTAVHLPGPCAQACEHSEALLGSGVGLGCGTLPVLLKLTVSEE